MTSTHIRIIILVALFTLISSARLEAFNLDAFNPDAFNIGDFTDWQFPIPPTATAVGSDAATKLLPKLVGSNDQVAQNLGFNAAAEVTAIPSNIHVGSPYPVFRISIEHLKNFNWKEQNPISLLLLEKTNFLRWSKLVPAQFLFPITSGNDIKSSVLVGMSTTDHGWRMLELGSWEMIKQLTQFGTPPQYFVVEVQALDRIYLGTIVGKHFTIKHVVKERVHDIEVPEGVSEPALEVFKRLQLEAAQVYANQVPR